jgi:hypothetical protein
MSKKEGCQKKLLELQLKGPRRQWQARAKGDPYEQKLTVNEFEGVTTSENCHYRT